MPNRLLIAAALLCATPCLHAAVYCVGAEAALYAALDAAKQSPEDDEIRLLAGRIELRQDLDSVTRIEGGLKVRGGYTTGCQAWPSNASRSTLSGNGHSLRLFLRSGALQIERMDFAGFDQVLVTGNMSNVATGSIDIVRSAFRDGRNGLVVEAWGHDIRVSDSMFVGNAPGANGDGGIGLRVFGYRNGLRNTGIAIHNITAVNNAVGLQVEHWPDGTVPAPRVQVINMVGDENAVADLQMARSVELRSSMVATLVQTHGATLGARSGGNLVSDPELDALSRPIAPGSPAIDSGDGSVLPRGPLLVLPLDYAGNPRLVGVAIDRGAFEVQ